MPLARSYAWASLAQLARHRPLSTTSAIASTSGAAARPQDVTFCDKPVAEAAKTPAQPATSDSPPSPWALRLSQKLQFARYTLELAEKGGGPGLADHIRRRLMRVAEAELEEGSWVAAGSVPSLPQEAHMAATAYRLGIRSMKRRGEHEAATQMMEDWLRFAATQRMYDPATLVDTKTLQIVMMGVCKQARTSQGSQEYWHDALVRLWDATKAAGIDWTPRMYRNANVVLFSAADLSTERVVAAVELLSKQLNLYWQHRFVKPTAQDSQARIAEGSPLNRTGPSMQHVAQALSVMRHRLSTVAQLGHTNEADYWSEALRNYLWTMRSISRLFSKAFLPLPFFHDQMIAPLYREVFVAFPQALRYGHLPPLTSQVDRDFVAHYRANVDVFLMATFDRGKVKEVRDANNLRGERRDRLQQMHLSSYLYVACLTYAYRDSSSLTRQTRFVRAILSHLSRAGVHNRRVNLVLFNEAVRLRQEDVEQALLSVLLVQNGVRDAKMQSSRPIDDSDLLSLIHAGSKRRDAFHSHILLRYVAATGWLRSKPQPQPQRGDISDQPSNRNSLDAETIVRLFLPTLPKSADATHVATDVGRDSWWLTDAGLCTALLNLALKSGRWPLAQKLWAYIRTYRPAPSVAEATCYLQHFTALVRATVRGGDVEGFEDRRLGVWEVYEGMREAWRLAEEKGEGTLNADARFWRALYEALGWDRVLRDVRGWVDLQQQRPQQQQQSPQAGIQPFSSAPPPQAPPPPFLHLAISGLPQLAHIAEEMASAAAATKRAALLPPPIVLWFLQTFGGEDGRAVCELAAQAREECLAVAAWARGRRVDDGQEDENDGDAADNGADAQALLDSYLKSHEGLDRSRRGAQDDAHSDEVEVDEALARAFAQREQEAWLRRTSPSTKAKGTRSARMPVEWSRGKGAEWEKLKVKREEKEAARRQARAEVQQPIHEQAENKRQRAGQEG